MGMKLPKLSKARGPESTAAPAPSRRGLTRFVPGLLLILMLFGLGTLLVMGWYSSGLTDARLLGAPVLAPSDDGGRIFLVTGQWRTTYTSGRYVSSRTYTTDLLVDLWAIRASDATPVWRRRLQRERSGAMDARSVLGVDGETIWLFVQGQLVGASTKTGDIVAGVGRLERENPELKGLMPSDTQYITFDTHGLRIKAADAREWYVDGVSFKVRPAGDADATPGDAIPPAYFTPAATHVFMTRGIAIPGWWLGLMTDEEAEQHAMNAWGGIVDQESRRRLWSAKESAEPSPYPDRKQYVDATPLPASPEFLGGGLLHDYLAGPQSQAFWFRDPDSVLVLHRDRLGDTGTYRVTRVAGPEGTVVWEAPLPLTMVQSVMRSGDSVVMFGNQFLGAEPGQHLDPSRDAPARLVSLSAATGQVRTLDFADTANHPKATPVDIAG